MTTREASFTDRLFALAQWCLPTRAISRLMHGIAEARMPWLKNRLIRGFINLYRVDMSEAEEPKPEAYANFNAFFTRRLKPGARPEPSEKNAVVCPVDGRLGAFGSISQGRLLQAKGIAYDLSALLGGEERSTPFLNGHYATLYLAPNNYHRVHMPMPGVLRESLYLPGRLFGVNPASVRSIPRLFTRNERLAARFETPAGPMAAVLVGAFVVGGIRTVWSGDVTPPHRRRAARATYPETGETRIRLDRGAELGAFSFGSTVILLFGPGVIEWHGNLRTGMPVRMNQTLARTKDGA